MAAVQRRSSSGSARPPPLTQTDAITSLLSLSIAAANETDDGSTTAYGADYSSALDTDPISDIPTDHGTTMSSSSTSLIIPPLMPSMGAPTTTLSGKHHRRLGSTGQTRRRLSDAREATTRPILAPSVSSGAALSLASLSLSTSPPSSHSRSHSHSLSHSMQSLGHGHPQSLGSSYSYGSSYPYAGIPGVSGSLPSGGAVPIPIASAGSVKREEAKLEGTSGSEVDGERNTKPISILTSANGKAKKRGVDYKCESCAKIYRHPNCLNKHRWEHTRQWREASKFVLSKHQQVQLLEAATILSFMGTASTSLPDDRSEWPSFVSGGSLPKTEQVGTSSSAANGTNVGSEYPPTSGTTSGLGQAHYAPQHGQADNTTTTRTTTYALQPHLVSSSVPNVPSGPRMHDYSLRAAGSTVKVTQVRPGLLGVPTTSPSNDTARGTPPIGETGGWSLPSSSLRSRSHASRSRSRSHSRSPSGSRSDESVDIAVDIEGMDEEPDVDVHVASANSALRSSYIGYAYGVPAGFSQSPGYGFASQAHPAGYGGGGGYPGRRGAGMKREEDEMSVGFSVREEDEEDEEDEDVTVHMRGSKQDSKWDGMEMELDMDMD